MRPFLVLLCPAVILLIAATSGEPGTPKDEEVQEPRFEQEQQPPIRKIGPHLYRIGAVVVDSKGRSVRCRGRVNMDEGGPIELLACLPRGKTHESVFTLDLAPKHLQVALLLLDVKDGRNPAVEYPEDSVERLRPPGDKTLVFVEWEEPTGESEGRKLRRRAEEFLYNVQADTPMAQATWIFTGSRMVDGKFGADLDGTLITTYHDPLAILELCDPTVNDDIYYFVNAKRCPPVGTPVTLMIQVVPKVDAQKEGGESPPGEDDE